MEMERAEFSRVKRQVNYPSDNTITLFHQIGTLGLLLPDADRETMFTLTPISVQTARLQPVTREHDTDTALTHGGG